MALIKCKKCNNCYPDELKECPYCNDKNLVLKVNKKKILFILIVLILLIISFFVSNYFDTRCYYNNCFEKAKGLLCPTHSKEIELELDYLINQYNKPSTSDLKLSNVKLDKGNSYSNYYHATGTLTNNSSKTVKFVKVKVQFKSSYGSIIDTDWTYAVGSEGLDQYESVKWECSVKKDYSISSVSAEVMDFDY